MPEGSPFADEMRRVVDEIDRSVVRIQKSGDAASELTSLCSALLDLLALVDYEPAIDGAVGALHRAAVSFVQTDLNGEQQSTLRESSRRLHERIPEASPSKKARRLGLTTHKKPPL